MFCTRCGMKNDDMAKFCGACGAPMTPPPVAEIIDEPKTVVPETPVSESVLEQETAVLHAEVSAETNAAPQEPVQPDAPQPYSPMQPEQVGYYPPMQPPYQPPYAPQPFAAQPNEDGNAVPPYYQQPYYGYYGQPYVPKKKKIWPIFVFGAAAVAVIVIALLFLLGSGATHNTPEDAALAFVRGVYTADWEMCESALHPKMIPDDFRSEFNEDVIEELEEYGIKAEDFEVEEVRGYSRSELEYAAEQIFNDYGLTIEDVKTVVISYDLYRFGWDWEETDAYVVVVEIDGDWYAVPDL